MSHMNHHNESYRKILREKCSTTKAIQGLKAKAARNLAKKLEEYNLNPTKCTHCEKELSYEKGNNKFCNSSCAASFNNLGRTRTEESKNKLSKVMKSKYPPKPMRAKLKLCPVCNNNLHVRGGKTCSDQCKDILISKSVKKAHKDGRHLGNKYRSRSSPSYMERTFKEWLDRNFTVTYEAEKPAPVSLNGKYYKTYYLDFYFPDLNLCIELDGSHHIQTKEHDLERDNLIIQQYGMEIIRIPHKEYISKNKEPLIREKLKDYANDPSFYH